MSLPIAISVLVLPRSILEAKPKFMRRWIESGEFFIEHCQLASSVSVCPSLHIDFGSRSLSDEETRVSRPY